MKYLSNIIATSFFVLIISLSGNSQTLGETKIIGYKDYERFSWGIMSNNLERWHVLAFSINNWRGAKEEPFVVIYEKDVNRPMNTIKIVSYQGYKQFGEGVRQENAADWCVEAFAVDPNSKSGATYVVVYVRLIKKRSAE